MQQAEAYFAERLSFFDCTDDFPPPRRMLGDGRP
jgi:hypothetical protein